MTRRYRFVEHANDSVTGLLLLTTVGAIERKIEVQADDDLIVLFRPGMDPARLASWAARICEAGDVVVGLEPT